MARKLTHPPGVNNNWLFSQMSAQVRHVEADLAQAERPGRRPRRMTVMAFLDRLAETAGDWTRREGALVDQHGVCPHALLDSYTEHPFTGPGAIPVADLCAAARNLPGHDPKIREALLQACGLGPDTPPQD